MYMAILKKTRGFFVCLFFVVVGFFFPKTSYHMKLRHGDTSEVGALNNCHQVLIVVDLFC